MDIEAKLKLLPQSPGVYIMKGRSGVVLYIGKAKNLRSRVASYFRSSGDTRYAVRFLSSKVEDIDWIVTLNETEALLLEDTLLKRHKPKYNIQLKDSKTYVSIKITLKDEFPRITVTRQIKKDGSKYFGPYVSSRTVRDMLKFIRKIFPLRTCSQAVFNNRSRPCLDYQLGICAAPAAGYISAQAYRGLVDGAILFLEGKNSELVRLLKARMTQAASEQRFEEAGRLRDRIASIEEMLEEQKVVSHKGADRDILAVARGCGSLIVQTLHVREGRLCAGQGYPFEDAGLPDDEVVSAFITQFYRAERYVPQEIICPVTLEDADVIKEWLSLKKGARVELIKPSRGERSKLLAMAMANAAEGLRKRIETKGAKEDVIAALKERFRLRNLPRRIEAFDISNISGALAVGAMVVFKDGEPDKAAYRHYRIKGASGPDDYAMMQECFFRRYRQGGGEAGLPDLILVDGGKGQMNVAIKALEELDITGVDILALAKDGDISGVRFIGKRQPSKGERVFLPNVKDPIILREGTPEDLLLRRIRDEVHRFAVGYHRRLRSKTMVSALDAVPGLGPKRRAALFKRFTDLAGVLAATEEELCAVSGVTTELARAIKAVKAKPR